jgi:hypothetical protein
LRVLHAAAVVVDSQVSPAARGLIDLLDTPLLSLNSLLFVWFPVERSSSGGMSDNSFNDSFPGVVIKDPSGMAEERQRKVARTRAATGIIGKSD